MGLNAQTNAPRSIAALSHAVAASLRETHTEDARFRSMALCQEILAAADATRDEMLRSTLRGWIGKVQAKYQ